MQVRCAHCHTPIDLPEDSSLSAINCPACGSSFSLVGEEETATYDAKAKTIGHFELVEQIGAGTFGSVWRAKDTDLDRTVAIKIPRKGQLDPTEAEQFLREARTAAQLRHPSIVTVHEVGRAEDTVYIVSDFIEGVTLADWLTGQSLTSREAAELCAKIADALHHAHEAGVIHRDLKPGNIILDAESEPHIMDFGLARREAGEVTMTVEGKVLGTPAYMSPEQAKGDAHTADRRSDVYSLGVILFELLTGERPFRGNIRMLMHQVIHEEATSPRKLNSNVPRDMETICLKCLEKEPGKRYDTAEDLADELSRFIHGEPIHARPVGRVQRAWRWCKRKPVVASLAATVAVVLLAGTVISLYFSFAASNEAERNHRLLYISDMNVAQQAWQENNVVRLEDLLRLHSPSSGEAACGFEWYYLWGLLQKTKATPTVKLSYSAFSVAFSPDESLLAVGQSNNSFKFLDPATRKEKMPGFGPANCTWYPARIAFAPTGKLLAYPGENTADILMRDLNSEKEVCLSGHKSGVLALAFSPKGDLVLASGSMDGTVKIWNPDTHAEINKKELDGGWVRALAFTPDGNTLACGLANNTVMIWDRKSSEEPKPLLYPTTKSPYPRRGIWSVAFSPSGRLVAAGSTDHTVRVWNWNSGELLHTLDEHTDEIRSVLFLNEDTVVSTSRDNTLKIWDLTGSKFASTLKGHSGPVTSVAISPKHNAIVSASSDGTLRFWPLSTKEDLERIEFTSWIRDVVFSPDGKHLAVLKQGEEVEPFLLKEMKMGTGARFGADAIVLRDVRTGEQKEYPAIDSRVLCVDISSDAMMAAGQIDGTLVLWDLDAEENPKVLDRYGRAIRSLAFSPDGTQIAFGVDDNTVSVWNITTEQVLKLGTHADSVECLAFSPDGEMLASGSADHTVKLWDWRNEKLLRAFKGHTSSVMCVAFSPDGKTLVSGSFDSTVRLWDWADETESDILTEQTKWISSILFSRDGSSLITAGGDHTVKIWDWDTRQLRFTFTEHRGGVQCIALSPDQKTLASGSRDRTVRLWHAATEKAVKEAGW